MAAWALSDVGLAAVAPGGADAQSLAAAAGGAAAGVGVTPPVAKAVTPASGGFLALSPPTVPPTTVPTTVPPTVFPPAMAIIEAPRAPVLAATPVPVTHAVFSSAATAGVASWLNTIPAGTCANNAAPMGATITVTNRTGVSITCRVVSRGPFVSGRIVDLAEPTFARLGSVSAGLVSVTVTW